MCYYTDYLLKNISEHIEIYKITIIIYSIIAYFEIYFMGNALHLQ